MSTEFSPQHTSAMLVCLSLAIQPAGVCGVYLRNCEFHLCRRRVIKKERKNDRCVSNMALNTMVHLLKKLSNAQSSQTWSTLYGTTSFGSVLALMLAGTESFQALPASCFHVIIHIYSSLRIDLLPRVCSWIICARRTVHLRHIRYQVPRTCNDHFMAVNSDSYSIR